MLWRLAEEFRIANYVYLHTDRVTEGAEQLYRSAAL